MINKCWKKTRDDKTGVDFHKVTNKNMIGNTTRLKEIALRSFGDKKIKWFVAVGNWGTGLKIIKNTKTKSEAIKSANAYMKKHNKCDYKK